jgi:hypothetical protein
MEVAECLVTGVTTSLTPQPAVLTADPVVAFANTGCLTPITES